MGKCKLQTICVSPLMRHPATLITMSIPANLLLLYILYYYQTRRLTLEFRNNCQKNKLSTLFWYTCTCIHQLLPKVWYNCHMRILWGSGWCKVIKCSVGREIFQRPPLAHMKSYLLIICPNSHWKLTKSEIRSSWSQFEHCSESLI